MARPRKTDQELQAEGKYRKENGRIYKLRQNQLRRIQNEPEPQGYMRSPKTGRLLKIGSYTYKKVWGEIADYYQNIAKTMRRNMKKRQRQNKKLFDEIDELLRDNTEHVNATVILYVELNDLIDKDILIDIDDIDIILKDNKDDMSDGEIEELETKRQALIDEYEEMKKDAIEQLKMEDRQVINHNGHQLAEILQKKYEKLCIYENTMEKIHSIFDDDVNMWLKIKKLCNSKRNNDLGRDWSNLEGSTPQIVGILITHPYELDEVDTKGEKRIIKMNDIGKKKVVKELLQNALSDGFQKIISKYTTYQFNEMAENFGDMFKMDYCDYVIDNYKINSCLITAIVNTYHDKNRNGRYKEFTYKRVCDAIGIQNMSQNIMASIEQIISFLSKYNLGLNVFSTTGHLIYRYRPSTMDNDDDKKENEDDNKYDALGYIKIQKCTTLNSNIRPQVMSVIISTNHAYEINDNEAKIRKMDDVNFDDCITKMKASDRFPFVIKKYEEDDDGTIKEKKPLIIYVKSLDEVVKRSVQHKNDDIDFKIQYVKLEKVCYDMVMKNDIIPAIFTTNNTITRIMWKIGKRKYTIESPVTKQNEGTDDEPTSEIIQQEQYELYNEWHEKVYDSLLNKQTMSDYPEHVREFEKKYPMCASTGILNTCKQIDTLLFTGLDVVRAYTGEYCKIQYVPIFRYFDIYTPYVDGEEINQYFMYAIECEINEREYVLIFDKKYSRVYGFVLLELIKMGFNNFKIHYVRKYSKLEKVDYKKVIEGLYNTDLDDKLKKKIVNMASGMQEKRKNRITKSYIIKNLGEAQILSFLLLNQNIKSSIYPIWEHDKKTTLTINSKLLANQTDDKGVIYMLNIYNETDLCEGFISIKEIIYCTMKLKMFNLYKKASSIGLHIAGIRTDSLLCYEKYDDVMNLIKDGTFDIEDKNMSKYDNISKIRIETGKQMTGKYILQHKNDLIEHNVKKVHHYELKDEWNEKSFKKIFDKHNRILVKSSVPGSGKTYSVINYCTKNKRKLLMVCPYNFLALDLKNMSKELMNKFGCGFDVMTCHKLLRINPFCKHYSNMEKIDISKYDTICFDETYLHNYSMKKMIDKYMKEHEHSDIKFISTGDTSQCDPVGDSIDEDNDGVSDIDHDKIIDSMFQHQITLKENKRLTNIDERNMLHDMKNDIFNENIPIIDTLKKFNFKIISNMKDCKSDMNITYSNRRAENVNKYCHNVIQTSRKVHNKKYQINGVNYWIGLSLICRKASYKKNLVLYTNNIYKITNIDMKNNKMKIKDIFEEDEYYISFDMLKWFKLAYCRTGHSCQGMTFNNNITIFELDSAYVNRKWAWTVLTRARKFEQIQIYKDSDEYIAGSRKARKKLYFNEKIKGYMRQDNKAERKYDENKYVNYDWMLEQIEKQKNQCKYCQCGFNCDFDNGRVITNLSINRLDNNKPHHKRNCCLACVACNVKLSDKFTYII